MYKLSAEIFVGVLKFRSCAIDPLYEESVRCASRVEKLRDGVRKSCDGAVVQIIDESREILVVDKEFLRQSAICVTEAAIRAVESKNLGSGVGKLSKIEQQQKQLL